MSSSFSLKMIIVLVFVIGSLVILKKVLFDSFERIEAFPQEVLDRLKENKKAGLGRMTRAAGYRFGGPDHQNATNLDAPYTMAREGRVFSSPDPMRVYDMTDSLIVIVTGPRSYSSGWRFMVLLGNDARVVLLDRETLEPVRSFRFLGDLRAAVIHDGALYITLDYTNGRIKL